MTSEDSAGRIVVTGSVDRPRALPPPRRPRWPVVVALVVLVVALAAWKRRDLAAWLAGTPDRATLVRQDRAATLRKNAFDLCARRMWSACVAFLDQARELDPQGDADARVRDARAQAAGTTKAP